jgi:hypothetical protein
MLNHIVLLQLKQGVDRQAVKEMYRNVYRLKDQISGIVSITGGANNSLEGLTKGFTEGFIVIFKDSQARDAYLPHPDHRRVAEKYIIPIAENVLVYDYEAERAEK